MTADTDNLVVNVPNAIPPRQDRLATGVSRLRSAWAASRLGLALLAVAVTLPLPAAPASQNPPAACQEIAGSEPWPLFRAAPGGKVATGRVAGQVDLSLLALRHDPCAPSRLLIDVPEGAVVVARERVQSRGPGDYSWFGKTPGAAHANVVLTVAGGVLYGHLQMAGRRYALAPQADGYLLVEETPGGVPPFADDMLVPPPPAALAAAAPAGVPAEDGSVINVLALYTARLQAKYGAGVNTLIQHFVDLTNNAYVNSLITTRLRLVGVRRYDDPGAAEAVYPTNALMYLTGDPAAAALRDAQAADLVALLREFDGSTLICGIAWVMQQVNAGFAPYAFSLIQVRPIEEANPYYCSSLTFAHEIGHNLGCAHDRDHASVAGAYPYAYGYDVPNLFATIMSYDSPQIDYFSNPDVRYGGVPIGVPPGQPQAADNALAINNSQVTVANFRVAPPAADRVYTVPPCRVLDTRIATATGLAGRLAPEATAQIRVTGGGLTGQGGAPDCGVPAGARGAFINVTAVGPQGGQASSLTLYPYGGTRSETSTIHFQPGWAATANGVMLPLCGAADCPYDLTVTNGTGASVHLVIDVTGYLAASGN